MITEYLRYTIEPSRQSSFIEHYKEAAIPLLNSPFCKAYEFYQCEEDESQFIIRIEWTSTEDHINKFRKSDDFRSFLGHVRPYIKNIDEMRHYRLVDSRKSE